jgi:hypothetical protein
MRQVLWIVLLAAAALATAPGCLRTRPSLTDPDPANKIPAMREAADRRDYSAAPQLVRDLDDDDPAVRFYAIRALQSLAGESFGYRYYDERAERKPSVRRWQQWLAAHAPAAPQK